MSSRVPPPRAPAPPLEPSLRRRAVRGSLWWAATYPISKTIQIAGSVVLARLLSPVAFGIVAIADVAARGLRVFTEIGIGYALIRGTRDDDRYVNTAWTLQIGRGVLLALLCLVFATPIASIFGEPRIAPVIRVISLTTLVGGFQSTKWSTLNRTLQEKPRALLSVASSILSRGAMIAFAWYWPTAMALVLGTLAECVFFTIASHFLPGRRNRLQWDRSAAKSILQFGSWVVVGTVIAYVDGQVDTLILGKLVSRHLDALGLVGVFGIAERVAKLPQEVAEQLGGQLALPVLSEVERLERPRFRERLLQIRRVFLPVGFTLCLCVVVIAPWFFHLLYDRRYEAARWMAPLLTLTVWARILNQMTNTALLALGKTRALALTGGIGALTSLGCGTAGFFAGDIPGFILGLAVGDLLRHVVELWFLARCGVGVHAQDAKYTAGFMVVAGFCSACQAYAEGSSAMAIRWGVGAVAPGIVLLTVGLWTAQRAWRLVRMK